MTPLVTTCLLCAATDLWWMGLLPIVKNAAQLVMSSASIHIIQFFSDL